MNVTSLFEYRNCCFRSEERSHAINESRSCIFINIVWFALYRCGEHPKVTLEKNLNTNLNKIVSTASRDLYGE